MIRFVVQSPFRYQYANKDTWLLAHESYYLNPNDKDNRREIKFILSDLFQFKHLMRVEQSQIPQDLLDEIEKESGEVTLPENPSKEDQIVTVEAPIPIQEARPNKFVEQFQPTAQELIDVVVNDEESVSTPIEELKELVNLPEPIKSTDDLRTEREEELEGLHWAKIKEIAAEYDITYTQKDSTIRAILDAEFE